MDAKDLEILKLVQSNARLTADAMAPDIGLSPAAVQKRLRKLRETGVIEKEAAILSPAKLGRSMTMIAQVSLVRENRAQMDDFKRKMRAAGNVQQCYYATGDTDFFVIAICADMEEYDAFTQEYFVDDANVSHFTTSVVMDRVKVSLDIL